MKLEKVNDNQIICTLSSQDLINNKIKLSELAFGSEKAKQFFQDIMVKAQKDFGFNGLNTPLMIEAVPQLPDCLKLIITKINNSKNEEIQDEEQPLDIHFQGADGILNLFKKLRKAKDLSGNSNSTLNSPKEKAETSPIHPMMSESVMNASDEVSGNFTEAVTEAFRFSSVDKVIPAAKALKDCYDGENSLYKDGNLGDYLLVLRSSTETPEEFNKFCNILSEYSVPVRCTQSGEAYLREHGNTMIDGNALQILAAF